MVEETKDSGTKSVPKKEKPPALEEKPFAEFITNHYLSALEKALKEQGLEDLQLSFTQATVDIVGLKNGAPCDQVIGTWNQNQRQFNIYFFDQNIQGKRGFSYNDRANKPSTIEPFLIDERKITLDLLVFGVVQRLNAQKWLKWN
jgi:hypothetical protein